MINTSGHARRSLSGNRAEPAMGRPSPARVARTTGQPPAQQATLTVTAEGYSPAMPTLAAGVPVKLVLKSSGLRGCIRSFRIPSLGLTIQLPPSGSTVVEIPAQRAGSVLPFQCGMGMYKGTAHFE